jgi:hypothetical protein
MEEPWAHLKTTLQYTMAGNFLKGKNGCGLT